MKWHKHTFNVTKRASQTLGFLRRNLCTYPIDCRGTTYIALVCPIMEYAGTVWDPYFKKDVNRLVCINRLVHVHALLPRTIVLGKKAVSQNVGYP